MLGRISVFPFVFVVLRAFFWINMLGRVSVFPFVFVILEAISEQEGVLK